MGAGNYSWISELLPYIAMIGGGYLAGQGGGDNDITSYQSPEQASTYRQLEPLLARLMSSGLTGKNAYQIPGIDTLMPSNDWYSNLSPEVMQGVRAPYEDASKQLTESLGYSAGSAKGGASGTLGGAQGKFWADAETQMGQQAWGMTQPAYSAGWQAQLQQAQMPYNMMPGLLGGSYSQPVIQPDNSFNYGNALMGGMGAYGMYNMFNPKSKALTDEQGYNPYA